MGRRAIRRGQTRMTASNQAAETARSGASGQDGAPAVFLSYSRADQARARPVIDALITSGFTVWWDGMLRGGENFLPTTEAALEQARAVVVLWSKTSVDSHWVRDEAQRGRERGCLVPLAIDGSQAPLGFRQFQLIDVSRWRGRADAPEFQPVLDAVAALVGRAPDRPVGRNAMIDRRALIGGGALLVAAGTGLAVWRSGWLSGPATPDDSIAVRPLQNLSEDPGQDYFSEGLTDEIRLALSRNARLRVLAQTSTNSVRDSKLGPSEIAQKLGVAYLLGGSVRRSGEALRITAELTDGRSGTNLWADVFDRKLADIFALQSEIAGKVAGAMSAQAADGDARSKLADAAKVGGTRIGAAYDAFLRGQAYYALRSGEAAYRAALTQYSAAIAADPRFARAHAARALVLLILTSSYAKAGELRTQYDDVIVSARRAVELAPGLAMAQAILGYSLVQARFDLSGARRPFELANRLGQGDATVLTLYAGYQTQMGRAADALTAIKRAASLDPLNAGVHRGVGWVQYFGRDFESAIDACQQSIAINADVDDAHGITGDSLYQQGKFAEALAAYQKEPGALLGLTGLAVASQRMGDVAAAREAQAKLQTALGAAATYQQAQIAAQWGDAHLAMDLLQQARAIGDSGMTLLAVDPMFDPLRKRPDFIHLLKGLGFD